MQRFVSVEPDAVAIRVGHHRSGPRHLVAAAVIAAALIVSGAGGTQTRAGTGGRSGPAGPGATVISVQSSQARVRATAYDGGGPTHLTRTRQQIDVVLFDESVRADDTDDADRGALGTAGQFTSVVAEATSIIVHSTGTGTARLYDSAPADGFKPEATGLSTLTVTIEVSGGMAVWSLRGSLEGDSDAANLDCGSVILTAPDGSVTRANGECELDGAVAIDLGGALAPGSHTLEVSAGASVRTTTGRGVQAGARYDLVLVVGACTVTGSPGGGPLDGTSGDDVICGLGGPDIIEGFAGDDTIFGGPGPDDIAGGPGDDTILGGDGDDIIQGGSDSDIVFAGPDDDLVSDLGGPNGRLNGDGGADTICGSNQRDAIDGGPESDVIIGLGGRDSIAGGKAGDLLIGDGDAGLAATFECDPPSGSPSGDQGDTIDGGAGDDSIVGGSGRDLLLGGTGEDEISGGPAADAITGGRGRDILRGDAASDILNACDGFRDRVNGGAGSNDVARRDPGIDLVGADVEVRRGC